MHQFLIGQTGTGKSSLLRELITYDQTPTKIVFDTKGTLPIPYDKLIDPDTTRWNPFAEPIDRNLAPSLFSNTVLDVLGRTGGERPLWVTNLSVILTFTVAAMIEGKRYPSQIPQFLTDPSFRDAINITNKDVEQFWERYDHLRPPDQNNISAVAYSLFACLFADTRLKALLSTSETKLSLSKLCGQTVLIRLPVSEYGTENVSLVASLFLAYISRLLPGSSIYIEGVHLFARGQIIDLLTTNTSALTITAQYTSQLETDVFDAILGNCETTYAFRVPEKDARILEPDRTDGTTGPWLYSLRNFHYRTLPYDKSPDGVTMPLEN